MVFSQCRNPDVHDELDAYERQLNIDTEKRIDAAYADIQQRCDSLMMVKVPFMVDSIIKTGNQP